MSLVAPEKPQVFRHADRIERNAQKIGDPIQRLKYLRAATTAPPPAWPHWGPVTAICMVALVLSMRSDAHLRRQPDNRTAHAIRIVKQEIPNVWRIEATKDYEVYSNGLRIENRLAVSNEPRSYPMVSLELAGDQRARPARLPLGS